MGLPITSGKLSMNQNYKNQYVYKEKLFKL